MAKTRPLVFDVMLTVQDGGAWRRVRISSGATLARAQRVFCVAFGWPGGAPAAFSIGDLQYERSGSDRDIVDVRLRHLLTGAGDEMEFEYGDERLPVTLSVRVDSVLPPDDSMVTPLVLAGEGWASREGADLADQDEFPPPIAETTVVLSRLGINLAAINAELLLLR